MSAPLPELGHVLPLGSEARWSDLLAALTVTDPAPLVELLGIDLGGDDLRVRREAAVDAKNRPDFVLDAGVRTVAVVEIKVLAGVGYQQLGRYEEAVPDAEQYVVITPGRLGLDVAKHEHWNVVTWESVLDAFAASDHPWVQQTALAWQSHLDVALPHVDGSTVWGELEPGADFVTSMRTRMSWMHGQVTAPTSVTFDLVPSSAGVSWILRLYAPTQRDGYWILVEVEERLPVRDFPKTVTDDSHKPLGPSAKVCLQLSGVATSKGFDWDHLLTLWHTMADARDDWVAQSPKAKASHDRDGIAHIRALGAPKHLGIGHGEGQAKSTGWCMFGARLQFSPSVTLDEVAAEVAKLANLTAQLAAVPHPGE